MAAPQHASGVPLTGRGLTRWMTLRYVAALIVIALLAVGSHVVLERLTTAQATTGAQVNVAGRQRMLSQRIAAEALGHLASGAAVGDGRSAGAAAGPARSLLDDADEMSDGQRALIEGDAQRGLPGHPSPTLVVLYEERGVTEAVDRYAALARVIARTATDDDGLPALVTELLQQGEPLLPALEQVVSAYQSEGEGHVATTARASWLLLGLTLTVLLIEALVVFAPLVRRLRATVDDVQAIGARLRATVDTAIVGVVTLDEAGHVTDVNEAVLELLGSAREDVLGTPLSEHVDASTAAAVADLVTSARSGRRERRQCTVLSENRRSFVAEISAATTPADRSGRRATVVVVTDVTERHAAEQVLRHRSQHDQLTGLPNRTVLRERLLRTAARSRTPRLLAVLVLDLDGFKAINDAHGHAAGDAVLVAVARRAAVVLREGDTVARFGGDEFVVLLEEIDSPADALAVAGRLAAAVREPVDACGAVLSVGVSIGAAVAMAGVPDEGRGAGAGVPTLEEMLRRADLAMYAVKKAGDEQPRTHHAGMETPVVAQAGDGASVSTQRWTTDTSRSPRPASTSSP